jgi:hypothetical protein
LRPSPIFTKIQVAKIALFRDGGATDRIQTAPLYPSAFDEPGQICDLIDRPLLPTHAESTRTGGIFETVKVPGLAGWCERWAGSRDAINRGLKTSAGRSLASLSSVPPQRLCLSE